MADEPPDPGGGNRDVEVGLQSIDMEIECGDRSISRKRPNPEYNTNIAKKASNNSHSVPSIQLNYVCPDFESKKVYIDNDAAPFLVHVFKTETVSGSVLRPMEFGQFLFKNKIKNVKIDGIKKIGRNRISVEFNSAAHANEFLNLSVLNTAGYTAVIPSYSISRMGTVRDIPVDWSMEELATNLLVPPGYGAVLKARRLSRKTFNEQQQPVWTPTRSVVLTFSGQKLPPHVYCYYTSLPVETYVLPTIQCNKCCRFGHIKAQCRSQPRCYKCGQSHEGVSCTETTVTCLHCSGSHAANNPSCPEHARQRDIKLVMSQESISYMEASARFPHVRRSFADSARTPPSNISSVNPKSHFKSPATTAYRKTTFTPRRPIPPVSPGYDRQAHRDIIEEPISQAANGCGFPSSADLSPNDNLVDSLVYTLSQVLSRFGDLGIPNKTRKSLTLLLNTVLNNGSVPIDPVELSQHQE